ncbi:hypothetical protein AB3M75_07350 [Serratia ureilytica]|uniref:hypothetical protein n=1 Tax=Serratia ureilytica TaxID=300181 RepID=UPI00370F9DE5
MHDILKRIREREAELHARINDVTEFISAIQPGSRATVGAACLLAETQLQMEMLSAFEKAAKHILLPYKEPEGKTPGFGVEAILTAKMEEMFRPLQSLPWKGSAA